MITIDETWIQLIVNYGQGLASDLTSVFPKRKLCLTFHILYAYAYQSVYTI